MKRKIICVLYLCVALLCTCNASVCAVSCHGSRGGEVIALQEALSALGYYSAPVDGIFGYKTYNAVREYQSAVGLTVDGVAGSKTLQKLGVEEDTDVLLLARVINGEARGESFEGQVAVGAVVLNRVKHPSFPCTLSEVIYQPGAFSAVDDGQINIRVNDSCIRAAMAALSGSDPTDGAVFYYNPSTATCKWIKTREIIKRIGNHLFCT